MAHRESDAGDVDFAKANEIAPIKEWRMAAKDMASYRCDGCGHIVYGTEPVLKKEDKDTGWVDHFCSRCAKRERPTHGIVIN